MELIQFFVHGEPPSPAGHVAFQAHSCHPFECRMQRAASDPRHEGVKREVGLDEGAWLASQDRSASLVEQHVQVELLACCESSTGSPGSGFSGDRRAELMQLCSVRPSVRRLE